MPGASSWLAALGILVSRAACVPTCPVALPFDWVRPAYAFPWRGSDAVWSFTRVFPERKLVLCTVPGAGSTPTRNFVNALASVLSHGRYNASVLPYSKAHPEMQQAPWLHPLEMMPREEVERIACDSTWTRIALVRNPFARLLSKFADKIVRHGYETKPSADSSRNDMLFRPPARIEDGLNFSAFTQRLAAVNQWESNAHRRRPRRARPDGKTSGREGSGDKDVRPDGEAHYVDEHFRGGSNFCGMRHVPYRLIRYESLGDGLRQLAAQLGVGSDPTIAQQLDDILPHNRCLEAAKLRKYYTASDVVRVRRYFHEDFVRFGYSPQLPPACNDSAVGSEASLSLTLPTRCSSPRAVANPPPGCKPKRKGNGTAARRAGPLRQYSVREKKAMRR